MFGHNFLEEERFGDKTIFKLIARDLINSRNTLEIATELSKTIYFDHNETEEQTLARTNEIK